MDNRKAMLLLVAPLAAIMLVSGCTTTTAGAGNGVVILDFQPDFNTVIHSGDAVKLQLRVQNQGEVTARNVEAELTNIDLTEWGTFGSFGFTESLGNLQPYDEVSNTPGAIQTKEWRLQAPDLAKGTSFNYEPMVKVSYDYKTTATKPITIVDQDELRRLIQQERTLPSKPTVYTSGPMRIEMLTGDFVRTSTGLDGDSYDVFPVYIKITNTEWESGGTVVDSSFGGGGFLQDYDYPVRVTINPPNGVTPRSLGSICSGTDNIDLWQGKDAEITCEYEVTNPPSIRQEALFTIEAEYRFQTQATTSVEVTGTDEGFGF